MTPISKVMLNYLRKNLHKFEPEAPMFDKTKQCFDLGFGP
jgi:hypothetical protein